MPTEYGWKSPEGKEIFDHSMTITELKIVCKTFDRVMIAREVSETRVVSIR